MIGCPEQVHGTEPEDALDSSLGAVAPGYAYSFTCKNNETAGFGGHACLLPEKISVKEGTLFDLASLTKPLCTALVALKTAEAGELDLDEPLGEGGGIAFTPLDLLRHEAGFPPWAPLYRQTSEPAEVREWLSKACPRDLPRRRAVYSCLGYIFLGLHIEERLGATLAELFERTVARPLGIPDGHAMFRPPVEMRKTVAGTEMDGAHEAKMAAAWRSPRAVVPAGGIWGIVHDGNARYLGGVAGNAGLFATCSAAATLAKAYLQDHGFLNKRSRELAFSPGLAPEGEIRTAGWKRSESPGWTSGAALPRGCVGHEGFTGTGAWLDPRSGSIFVLLTNRIHPSHPGSDFGPARANFLAFAQRCAAGRVRSS